MKLKIPNQDKLYTAVKIQEKGDEFLLTFEINRLDLPPEKYFLREVEIVDETNGNKVIHTVTIDETISPNVGKLTIEMPLKVFI